MNRKFDIGVYVTIASINPLRVYMYDKELLLRYVDWVFSLVMASSSLYSIFNSMLLYVYWYLTCQLSLLVLAAAAAAAAAAAIKWLDYLYRTSPLKSTCLYAKKRCSYVITTLHAFVFVHKHMCLQLLYFLNFFLFSWISFFFLEFLSFFLNFFLFSWILANFFSMYYR